MNQNYIGKQQIYSKHTNNMNSEYSFLNKPRSRNEVITDYKREDSRRTPDDREINSDDYYESKYERKTHHSKNNFN